MTMVAACLQMTAVHPTLTPGTAQYTLNREAIAKFFFTTGTAPELAGSPAFDEMVE